MAASSSLGRASRRSAAEWASAGRVRERVERWLADVMRERWERFERDWRERRRECEVCESDCGSSVVREERGSVDSRFR
jgi:hypothetical protein